MSLAVGDRVTHSEWADERRVGTVKRVFVQRFDWPGVEPVPSAVVEWPRPEGDLTHAVAFLKKVAS